MVTLIWRLGMVIGCLIMGYALYAWAAEGFYLEGKHDTSMVGRSCLYFIGLGLFIFLLSLFKVRSGSITTKGRTGRST